MNSCIICHNKYACILNFSEDESIKKHQMDSICLTHKNCLKCNIQLTLEEIIKSNGLGISICDKHWCCDNPWKFVHFCPVCKRKLICKNCSRIDSERDYVCNKCYLINQYYCRKL